MIKVVCRTNLDLNGEKWPEELPSLPRVGDQIESATRWKGDFRLTLQVVRVTFKSKRVGQYDSVEWYPEVELHMTDYQRTLRSKREHEVWCNTITAFYEWYAPKVGKSVGAFI